jgi:hypothetical protein
VTQDEDEAQDIPAGLLHDVILATPLVSLICVGIAKLLGWL